VRRTGPAATVVTWGAITHQVLAAADRLAAQSTPVTVIETPWLNPFDTKAVVESVGRTGGKLAVVHEANTTGGFGAEVVTRVAEAGAWFRAGAGHGRARKRGPGRRNRPPV
jgi:acetoin:2,6-dichlorophenolindophenol oxidoreductase subunit beta